MGRPADRVTRRLEAVTADGKFQQLVNDLVREKRHAEESPAWFQQVHPRAPFSAVAYFSMEFMLSEALPIYSGGLGNVAGDQLKTASNLGVPVVGIGLLYQQGYFRQDIDAHGWQQAQYPFNDPGQLPIRPLREANGEWLRFSDSVSRLPVVDSCLAGPDRPRATVLAGHQRPGEHASAS